MAKFRPRDKNNKGKRWKKGQSSSSNPETKIHRENAKSRFFQDNAGHGSLTTDALKKHDTFLGTKMDDTESIADDQQTFGRSFKSFNTFQTFASDWSLCSNQSFSKLLKSFSSDSALHKEMLAILAAVTEVIKQNGGTETVTEYFGALMTTLDVTESEESLTAVVALLAMGIKGVPQNVLQKKFPETSKTFITLFAKHAGSENNVLIKSLIGCLSVVLRAQEAAVWSNFSTSSCFDAILMYTTHQKPKIRKAAQHAVCAILRGSTMMTGEKAPAHHPAAATVANFCIRIIESDKTFGTSATTFHILQLLKEILGTFPKTQLKAVCEVILKVMTVGNILSTSCGMQALHGLFASRPSETSLSPALNAQLITALHDYQPAQNDTQPTLAWLAVMQEAYLNLARHDLTLISAHLPRLFTAVSQLWLSEKPEISSGATRCLVAVTQDCVAPLCTMKPIPEQHRAIVERVLSIIHSGFQYQYHSAWQHVLHVIATVFEVVGATCPGLMQPILKTLADLRDSYQFTYAHELEHAVGRAVRSMGPEAVLAVIPLEITGKEASYEFRRSWLLPVLKENIRNSQLSFFTGYFLPLATRCRKQSETCKEKNDMVGSHSYDLLQSQIWSLLPSFCNKPTDVHENFKNIARVLGTAVKDHKDLRLFVLSSLRKLITMAREKTESEEEDERAKGQTELSELARFSKNFLPILFNIYTTKPVGTDEEGQRLAAFETIKMYLSITDSPMSHDFFDKACTKLVSDESDTFMKESILDLLRALLPYQDLDRLAILFQMCEEGIGHTNHHIQKKAYRMLEEICGSDSSSCSKFISKNLSSIQSLLLTSLSKAASSSKGPRLRCLIHLVKRLDSSQATLLEQIVPEAVLCCKDLNEKCRSAAFTLLTQIGQMMLMWSDKPKDDIMKDYVGLLLAGLVGSPTLASATVLALAKVTYEFRATLPEDLVLLILDNICILCSTATREIVAACLSYIKVFITSFTTEEIGPSVPTIVKGMLSMTEDCKRYLRNKYRNIFDRLVRKFGWKPIADMVPSTDATMHKRLKNLRKEQERKKKKRAQSKDSESDNEDFIVKAKPKSIEEILADSDGSDMETEDQKTKATKKQNPKAWIQENEDNIVDFTDVSAAKKISATNPAQSTSQVKKKKEEKSIKIAADGRLMIIDESDSESEKNFAKSAWKRNVSDTEDEDDKSTVRLGGSRKRKLRANSDSHSEPGMKYQAGGSGIHRPTFKTKETKSKPKVTRLPGSEYKSSKAQGDVKKKGHPDPYAYVPMSRKLLNKRRKGKSSGQFKHLINKDGKKSNKIVGIGKGKKLQGKKKK